MQEGIKLMMENNMAATGNMIKASINMLYKAHNRVTAAPIILHLASDASSKAPPPTLLKNELPKGHTEDLLIPTQALPKK
eukprot:4418918-Ditylum_brightwellii.AAC.1